ncbi:MAG: class I SAM-dependent methyltransferase [Actinobacteria bacterium]|nr:class I SAM-dependent methyltransferase [Actinomycetota bacterium]
MAVTYGPFAQKIWEDAVLLPAYSSLIESLCSEIATFLDRPLEGTRELLEAAWNDRARQMAHDLPQHPDPAKLTHYYGQQTSGLLTSAYWHSLLPDRYALHSVSGLQCLNQFGVGPDVFEFGHGIGSTAILLARHGFDVTAGDISEPARAFAAQRFAKRKLPVKLLDLERESPAAESFDAVVSFDVLEHLPNPVEQIAEMRTWLRPGGLLVLNIAFGRDADNPEHILPYRLGVLNRVRGLGFQRLPWPGLYVFAKADLSRGKRQLFRSVDLIDATREDVVARWPKLTQLLYAKINPPIA